MNRRTCTSCQSALRPIEIKGYRMLIDDGRMVSGRRIETEACTACGLIHFYDPDPAAAVSD